jgi:integrase
MATVDSRQICKISSQERLPLRLGRSTTSIIKQGGLHSVASAAGAFTARDTGNAAEGRNSRSNIKESRVLFNIFPGTEERFRRDEASNKSQGSQQVCKMPYFQDALSPFYNQNDSQRDMAGVNRPEGCVLSYTNASQASQISEVCFSAENLSVQGAPLRLVNSTKGVHEGSSPGSRLLTSERGSPISLPRRLPVGSKRSTNTTSGNIIHHSNPTEPGILDQFQEIQSQNHSEANILGNGVGHPVVNRIFTQTKGGELSQSCLVLSPSRYLQKGETLFEVSRIDGLNLDDGSQSEVAHETSSDLPEFSLGPKDIDTGLPDYDSPETSINHSVVGQSGQFANRLGVSSQEAFNNCDDGCFQVGMGSALSVSNSPGIMESTPTSTTHQPVGANGSMECSKSFPTCSQEPSGIDTDGQHVGSALYQQFRRYQVCTSLQNNLGYAPMVFNQQYRAQGNTHSGQGQLLSRQIVPAHSQSSGMGTGQSGGTTAIPPMAHSHHRPVCIFSECQTEQVLRTPISSSGGEYGCSEHVMEGPLCLRVSSIPITAQSPAEDTTGPGNGDSDSSQLAQEGMVSFSPGTLDRISQTIAEYAESNNSKPGQSDTPQCVDITAGSLESERQRLLADGLSQQAAQTYSESTSTSTRKTYNAGWADFVAWCRRNNKHPHTVHVPTFLNYFQEGLDNGYNYNTMKSRGSAISACHPVFQKRIGRHNALMKCPAVQKFFKGAMLRFPPKKELVPPWDLPTVLDALARHPFEPIETIPLNMLSYKTAFLVAIASASRTCELKAFDRRPLYCTISARGVVLRVPQAFRPKVVKPANMARTMDFAPIQSDDGQLDDRSRKVCVCRAVQEYIRRTDPILNGNCTQLFVTFQKGRQGRPAAKQTIASWIKACVHEAYKLLPEDPHVEAHSTRKQSTTWAELKNISIRDICQMATWSSPNVFIKHYKLRVHSSVSARHANAVLNARH